MVNRLTRARQVQWASDAVLPATGVLLPPDRLNDSIGALVGEH